MQVIQHQAKLFVRYYPQGKDQAEATNKTLLYTLKKQLKKRII